MGAPLLCWGGPGGGLGDRDKWDWGGGAFPTHFPDSQELVPPLPSPAVGVVSPEVNPPPCCPGLSQEADAAPCCQPTLQSEGRQAPRVSSAGQASGLG